MLGYLVARETVSNIDEDSSCGTPKFYSAVQWALKGRANSYAKNVVLLYYLA